MSTIELVEARDRPRLLSLGIDTVDAAFVVAGTEIEFFLGRFGNPLGVLDHEAVHVANPQCAIGTGAAHAGTKPVVFGG